MARNTKTPPTTRRPATRPAARRPGGRRRWLLTAGALTAIGVVVAALLLTSRGGTTGAATLGPAPGFTLPSTAGGTVSLADYRGKNVLLFFNEGAGCDACFYQLSQLEKSQAALDKANITVLGVAPNDLATIKPELTRFGLRTPMVADSSLAASRAYDTLGRGMHPDLPGHTFVLVGPDGTERWRGDYPSMWVDPQKLLADVLKAAG